MSNLPYRRFPIGLTVPYGRTAAGWKPAIRQIGNLRYVRWIALALIVAVAAGCGPRHSLPHELHHRQAVEFQEGKGLFLPDITKQAIHLEIAEVTERKLAANVTTQVQVYRVDDPRRAWATGFLRGEDATRLRLGQPVTLLHAGSAASPLPGTLVRLVGATEAATGRIEALVEIPDPERRLRIGTLLEATFAAEREETVTAVPRSALLRTATGAFVYVVNGKHLLRSPVVPGAENDEFVELRDGVYEGDLVAAQPVLTLWLAELQFTKAGQSCTHGH